MTILLIRHAIAKDRHRWEGDDDARPLTKHGRAQADALVSQLGGFPIDRVLSSTAVRCVDTVIPLAYARGCEVEREPALAEGSGLDAARLVARLLEQGVAVALCTHGDVVPEVMDALDAECDRCAKGSTWVLERGVATYIPAP